MHPLLIIYPCKIRGVNLTRVRKGDAAHAGRGTDLPHAPDGGLCGSRLRYEDVGASGCSAHIVGTNYTGSHEVEECRFCKATKISCRILLINREGASLSPPRLKHAPGRHLFQLPVAPAGLPSAPKHRQSARLHLHLGKAVLPVADVRSHTVLTVVEQDDPWRMSVLEDLGRGYIANSHSIRIHGLAD